MLTARLHNALTRASPALFTLVAGLAGFGAYFAMYAFRKPFTAADFADVPGWRFAIGYKVALVIAQVAGYALSKIIGVKVIAEIHPRRRAATIIGLVCLSWAALVGFALVPAPWNVAAMFLNGLPLGMIWGLVFGFMEGRRVSEVLGAILCASFILSSGVVKSVGLWLMQAIHVDRFWMPAATGALFLPLLLGAVVVLNALPTPSPADERARTPRVPMDAGDRARFLRRHGLPMLLLVIGYVMLTAVRDLRDNFASEIWSGLGFGGAVSVFSESELPVSAIVLAGLGSLMLVRDNGRALLAMHGAVIAGALLLGLSTIAFRAGLLTPLYWMILNGAGLYLAYTPFNAMLFDRLIAFLGSPGNAGFLIYVADASGYVGSVGLLLFRSIYTPKLNWLSFFVHACYATAIMVTLFTALSASYFLRRRSRVASPQPA